MPRPHVVLVSQIPLWSMERRVGGPVFDRTLRALAGRYRVTLVAPKLPHVTSSDMPEDVTLVTFAHRLHGLWRQVPKLGWLTDTLAWYTFRLSAWSAVRRICRQDRVDLLYGYEIYGVPVAWKAGKAFGIPVVARYQGTLMSQKRYLPLAWLRFWKHLRSLRLPANLVIMTNDGTRGETLLVDLGIPRDRIRFWMNGTDDSIDKVPVTDIRPSLRIPPAAHVLLSVSRLSYWKRVDRALRVTADLAREGVEVCLVVVGTGPERSRLENLSREMGIEQLVRFVGAVERELLPSYYRCADVLLSLYDFSNLANPVIESMTLGLPVVVLDTGATSDLVQDSINGRLVPLEREDEVAGIVADLLADPKERDRLGSSARQWATENLWSFEQRMAAELDELDGLMRRGDAPAS